MSLNKTLDRLFDEIRREAKRNPEFADRLDAVMRLHNSRRDVDDEVIGDVSSPASGGSVTSEARDERGATPKRASRRSLSQSAAQPDSSPARGGAKAEPMPEEASLNPVGLYQREGEVALTGALEELGLPALQAMIAEHNLDPSGETAELDRDALVTHVLAHAKRRAERDAKMFDY